MMATGHMLSGSVLAGAIAPLVPSPLPAPAALLAGVALGAPLALLMDLDTRGYAFYLLGPVGWVLRPVLVWLACVVYAVTRGPADPEETNGHRMLTHQVEFAGMLALIAFVPLAGTGWEWWAATVVFVGVWAHRAGDACTKSGVPVSLTRVLIRMARGERKRWLRKGIPRRLRFVTNGWRTRHRMARVWDGIGERVVTGVLAFTLGGLLALAVSWL